MTNDSAVWGGGGGGGGGVSGGKREGEREYPVISLVCVQIRTVYISHIHTCTFICSATVSLCAKAAILNA